MSGKPNKTETPQPSDRSSHLGPSESSPLNSARNPYGDSDYVEATRAARARQPKGGSVTTGLRASRTNDNAGYQTSGRPPSARRSSSRAAHASESAGAVSRNKDSSRHRSSARPPSAKPSKSGGEHATETKRAVPPGQSRHPRVPTREQASDCEQTLVTRDSKRDSTQWPGDDTIANSLQKVPVKQEPGYTSEVKRKGSGKGDHSRRGHAGDDSASVCSEDERDVKMVRMIRRRRERRKLSDGELRRRLATAESGKEYDALMMERGRRSRIAMLAGVAGRDPSSDKGTRKVLDAAGWGRR